MLVRVTSRIDFGEASVDTHQSAPDIKKEEENKKNEKKKGSTHPPYLIGPDLQSVAKSIHCINSAQGPVVGSTNDASGVGVTTTRCS